jgi:NAD(P)H-dependent flavin oxidoreductase YrpB (nitropropane dioxygenase family)
VFKTKITEMLDIEYPIIQGGMQWIARAELVSAVSNAGGLGILSALTFPSTEELAAEIRRIKELTDKPFGVNLTLQPTLRSINYNAYIDTILQQGVKIVETAGRNPEPYLERLKAVGTKVIHKCTSVRFARTAKRIGCDAVSIDGFECAGHPGEEDVTSLILIPQTVDSIDIPIIASGGFADGRGLAAALALGASGVNMGTRFLATQESPAHPKVKEWLIQSTERDTMLVQRSLRNTHRVLSNAAAEKVFEMEKDDAPVDMLAPLISGQKGLEVFTTGDVDRGLVACGQVVGLIRHIPTVKKLVEDIIREAKEVVSRLNAKAVFEPVCKPV